MIGPVTATTTLLAATACLPSGMALAAAQTGSPWYYVLATGLLAVLGGAFGIMLYVGSRVFAVEVDPRVDLVEQALPGANCGACGFGGCRAYAEAVVKGAVGVGMCAAGGGEAGRKIAAIMGVAASEAAAKVAVVHCRGDRSRARTRGTYAGVGDCRAAVVPGAGGGETACPHACLGLGTCVEACPFDALVMGADGLPRVIERLCTGCGRCVDACPRGIIALHPRDAHVFVLCRSREKAKAVRAACDVGCIGCGLCVKACKFDAIAVVDNLAVIDDAKCKNCGACVKACPRGTIWNVRKARKEIEKTHAVSAACAG